MAMLRARSRGANKAAKVAAARISELEGQVAQLEQSVVVPPAAPKQGAKPKPAETAQIKWQGRAIDPGDAMPPGVAVQEPKPLDKEARSALENLEQLGSEQPATVALPNS